MTSDAPALLYYDRDGKQVPEGDPSAVRQYAPDDQTRPDGKGESSAVFGEVVNAAAPDILFYDGDGNQVPEGDPSAKRQFTADDPARPDAPKDAGTPSVPPTPVDETDATDDEATDVGTEAKAVTSPPANKAKKSSPNK